MISAMNSLNKENFELTASGIYLPATFYTALEIIQRNLNRNFWVSNNNYNSYSSNNLFPC